MRFFEKLKKNTLGPILTAWIFLLLLSGLFLANLFYETPELSRSERRYLRTLPAWYLTGEPERGINPNFSSQFEEYAMDRFLFRDSFRQVKAIALYQVFRQRDNHGIYFFEGQLGKLEFLNEEEIRHAGWKLAAMSAMLPQEANIYYALIPDKGHYLSQNAGGALPRVDYRKVAQVFQESMPLGGYIDLLPVLSAGAYYATDLHWDQTELYPVVETLSAAMGFAAETQESYSAHELVPFYGVYAGQSAMPIPGDTLAYLTSPAVHGAVVKYMNPKTAQMEEGSMYQIERFSGIDPYDIFLGGAQPIITIENPAAKGEKELILFRDSFGSSLAPLLTGAYAKITLIDLRYVDSRILDSLVDFGENPDVLFLYSSQVLLNSDILLISAH